MHVSTSKPQYVQTPPLQLYKTTVVCNALLAPAPRRRLARVGTPRARQLINEHPGGDLEPHGARVGVQARQAGLHRRQLAGREVDDRGVAASQARAQQRVGGVAARPCCLLPAAAPQHARSGA